MKMVKQKYMLPEWFAALNKDFRYQLTAIGAPGPNLHIEEEIHINSNNNSIFKIAGGKGDPRMKVSWQVTGIRQDHWAKANRPIVEEDKPSHERGYYIHPELYGNSTDKSVELYVIKSRLILIRVQLKQYKK